MKNFLIMALVVLAAFFAGCVKDGDETIALPDPGLSSGPASNAIPDALRGRLQAAMPLHSGNTPSKNVSGNYEADNLTLSSSNYSGDNGDYTKNDFVKNRLLADMGKFNFGFDEAGNLTFREGEGGGVSENDSIISTEITGDGDGFTAYIIKKGKYEGVDYKASVIISGTIKDDSIEDFHYTVILLEKGEDREDVLSVPEDTYFVFENKDGRPVSRLKPVYAVAFSANGGDGKVDTLMVSSGASEKLPDGRNLVWTGFSFDGWNTDSVGAGAAFKVGDSYSPTKSVTLYANWKPESGPPSTVIPNRLRAEINEYITLYDGNKPPDISGEYTTGSLTVTVDNYDRDYKNNTFINTFISVISRFEFKSGTGGKIYYRTGEPEGDLKYDTLDFIGSGNNFTAYFIKKGVYSGIAYSVAIVISGTLTNGGIGDFHYTFILLEKGSDSQGRLPPANTYIVLEDESGSAEKVKAKYIVKFDANGGGGNIDELQVTDGESITLPSGDGLTRNGFTFGGWNTRDNGNGTPYETGASYKPTADITLYAMWNAVVPDNTFTDPRDNNKTYTKVKIGTQTWMAENLNYDVPNNTSDVCYGNSTANCTKYGRLYDWATAMAACPTGWHLPSNAEWNTLVAYVGGASTAGTKLKSSSYWNAYPNIPAGTDNFGFTALPGGYYGDDGESVDFHWAGEVGGWWTSTEANENPGYNAVYIDMGFEYEGVSSANGAKTGKVSVRCVEGN